MITTVIQRVGLVSAYVRCTPADGGACRIICMLGTLFVSFFMRARRAVLLLSRRPESGAT